MCRSYHFRDSSALSHDEPAMMYGYENIETNAVFVGELHGAGDS